MTQELRRYLCFSGEDYYPNPGWYDWRGSHDELEVAVRIATAPVEVEYSNNPAISDWWHVVDSKTGEIVRSSTEQS